MPLLSLERNSTAYQADNALHALLCVGAAAVKLCAVMLSITTHAPVGYD
jgi:hypothetical protein